MSQDEALGKLSEKLKCRVLVKEEHGFQKGHNVPSLATGASKSPAWIGLGLFPRFSTGCQEGDVMLILIPAFFPPGLHATIDELLSVS